jgi:sugar phosphate isomerase/epimerase
MPYRETDFRSADVWKINLDFFRELLPYAKERGITICLENMPMPTYPLATPKQIMDFVNEIDDDNFKVCLDTGHSWVCEVQPDEAARIFGEALKVLHVHDNGGIKKGDQHLLPTLGTINWEDFSKALVEIGYDKWGVFNLECNFSSVLPNQSISSELKAAVTQMVAEAIAP